MLTPLLLVALRFWLSDECIESLKQNDPMYSSLLHESLGGSPNYYAASKIAFPHSSKTLCESSTINPLGVQMGKLTESNCDIGILIKSNSLMRK